MIVYIIFIYKYLHYIYLFINTLSKFICEYDNVSRVLFASVEHFIIIIKKLLSIYYYL